VSSNVGNIRTGCDFHQEKSSEHVLFAWDTILCFDSVIPFILGVVFFESIHNNNNSNEEIKK